jgi:hypothetical protein
MAYVCKQEFGKRNHAGAGVRFITKVYALSSGEFVFYDIPPNIIRMLENAEMKLRLSKDRSKTGLHVDKMKDGIRAIGDAMDALLAETITEELVIRYNYTATCYYFVANDGSMHVNGMDHDGRDGQWIEEIIDGGEDGGSWHSCSSWLIGFTATVDKKVTYTSGENVTTEYTHPEEDELGEWGNKLNAFVHTHMRGSPKELPYTEDVARMFYESMWKLCELARGLTEFLSEPDNVLKGTGRFLLPEGNPEQ